MIDRDQMRRDLLAVLAKHRPHPHARYVAELAGYSRQVAGPMLGQLAAEGLYDWPPKNLPAHRLRPSDLDTPTRILAERLGVTERSIRRYRASIRRAAATSPQPSTR
jgi:hypothetical protein